MSDQPVPRQVIGPLRRPDQSFGAQFEFATAEEAQAFITLAAAHFAPAGPLRDAPQITWHDVEGSFGNERDTPPPSHVPILIRGMTTSSAGWARVNYITVPVIETEGDDHEPDPAGSDVD